MPDEMHDTQEMPDAEEIEQLSEAFFALSNEQRLRLLHLLTEPKYREEIADALDMSRQSATKHIQRLEDSGFIREMQGWRETGPVDEYQVNPSRLFALGMRLVDLGKLQPEGGPEALDVEDTRQLAEAPPELGGEPLPAERTGHLLILDGPDAGDRFPLDGEGPRWTIGRSEDRDLRLDHDPYVSARQCEIQVAPSGHAVVDVYSSNGTFVNFGQLPEGGRAELEPGDVIRIGRTSLVYQRK